MNNYHNVLNLTYKKLPSLLTPEVLTYFYSVLDIYEVSQIF